MTVKSNFEEYVAQLTLLMNIADDECKCATDKEIKSGVSSEYCPSCRAAKILNRFYEDAVAFIEEMGERMEEV